MTFNRKALKQHTKQLVRQGTPPVWQVTLVYILATTWLSTVCDLVVENPVNRIVDVMNDWAINIEEMGYVSQGAMDALTQQVWACFRGPAAMVGLLVALLLTFYSMVVSLGYFGYSLRVMRGQQAGHGELFSHFDLAGKVILLQILKFVFIYLWSLLFVIPGIVAAYRYRLAEYCLLDDPDISTLEAIRRSKALTRGKKGELFTLDLSFLGWLILQAIAAELAYYFVASSGLTVVAELISLAVSSAIGLFVLSYQQLTDAGFYLYTLDSQAPPVQDPNRGFDRFERTNSPYDDEGWNR